MTDLATTVAPKRRNGAHSPALVPGTKLALHLGCTRQNIDHLVTVGIIRRRADGLFDQDQARITYIEHLRTARRQSPRSEADVDFQRAKAELIRLRIAEKQKLLMPVAEAVAHMDEVVGVLLTHLSALPVRGAGNDLPLRRRLDRLVYEMRVAISETANKLADANGEPPLDAGS